MQYFFDSWGKIENDLNKRPVALFLDYDGTLAPIAPTPDKAIMTLEVRGLLTALSVSSHFRVSIVSGRQIDDVKQMVNIPRISFIGSHGLEMDGSDLNFESLIPIRYIDDLADIKQKLNEVFDLFEGVWLEDKGKVLTLHFRQVNDLNVIDLIRKKFYGVCDDFLIKQKIKILEGHKVLEVRPPITWGKGEAVIWMLNKWKSELRVDNLNAFFIGDDKTDEEAFKIIYDIVETVRVGYYAESSAKYYLRKQEEILEFLKDFLKFSIH